MSVRRGYVGGQLFRGRPAGAPKNFRKKADFWDQGEKSPKTSEKLGSTVGRGSDHRFEADTFSENLFEKIPSENVVGSRWHWARVPPARGSRPGPAAAEDFSLSQLYPRTVHLIKNLQTRLKTSSDPPQTEFICRPESMLPSTPGRTENIFLTTSVCLGPIFNSAQKS